MKLDQVTFTVPMGATINIAANFDDAENGFSRNTGYSSETDSIRVFESGTYDITIFVDGPY